MRENWCAGVDPHAIYVGRFGASEILRSELVILGEEAERVERVEEVLR